MMMDCKWCSPLNEIVLMNWSELDRMVTCWRLVNDEKLIEWNCSELSEFWEIVTEVVWLNEFSPIVREVNLFRFDSDNWVMDVNDEWAIDNWINSWNWQKSITIGPLNELDNTFKYCRDGNDDWAMNYDINTNANINVNVNVFLPISIFIKLFNPCNVRLWIELNELFPIFNSFRSDKWLKSSEV